MKIFNTLTKKKEDFVPQDKDNVKIYQCGPTVYWTQHIGNLRASFVSDIVNRTLNYAKFKTTFVRNYTDVGHLSGDNLGDADSGEDRMEKASAREGMSPLQIAKKYTDQFVHDTSLLNIQNPTHTPKATENIQEMIEMISTLIEKGFAYVTPRAVYFDISKAKDYTKLSGQVLEKNISGEGHGNANDVNKKNPQDFALWFFKTGEYENALQTWQSPFESGLVSNGEGFPGWHIECSAMSKKFLGETLDIHMGGVEHISIHHTNEIAQSESANNVTFSKYWMHYEHLLVDNMKMSKSEGTGYSMDEILAKRFLPLSLRYFYLQAHYRSKQNFTWEALAASENGLNNLYSDIASINIPNGKINQDFKNEFLEKLSDDFNTPQALAVISEVMKSDISSQDKYATILDFDTVLGLDFEKNSKSKKVNQDDLDDEIKKLMEDRNEARNKKDFAQSDKLREEIESKGYVLKDTESGSEIYVL